MKEIKFRGKSISGITYYGFLTINAYGSYHIESIGRNTLYSNKVLESTVSIFSGFKDKNDIEIYENDDCNFIIEGLGEGAAVCLFINGCFFLKVENQEELFPMYEIINRKDISIELL